MRAIVAKRVTSGTADLAELRRLAEAAGHDVVGSLVQTRREDSAYGFGEGKVASLRDRVVDSGAELVLVDNRLGPFQVYNLGREMPEGVTVLDRFTLILDIFAQRAHTRKAQLQVELAELRYELPRAAAKTSLAQRDEHPGFMGLGEYDETRERDIKSRISRIRDELSRIAADEEEWRADRRESGFDLVALAGYTNAGKSTLLRRLASDLTVDENVDLHDDLDPTAASQDSLFTTLGTTTRGADVAGRDVLVTDTVGFIRDLPHWLVESFRSTLEQAYHADLLLLVVDASRSVADMRHTLVTCHDTLYERNHAPIVTVFNKIDRLDEEALAQRRRDLADLAPDPVGISARTGAGIDDLHRRMDAELPERRRERLVLPQSDATMSTISWIHDEADVEDVSYDDDTVTVTFHASESVISRARDRAGSLRSAIVE